MSNLNRELAAYNSIDWSPIAATMDDNKLDALQAIMVGNNGIISSTVFTALNLNTLQWDALMKHDIYRKYINRLLGQAHVGMTHLDKSQLGSIKLFLDGKNTDKAQAGDAPIEIVD